MSTTATTTAATTANSSPTSSEESWPWSIGSAWSIRSTGSVRSTWSSSSDSTGSVKSTITWRSSWSRSISSCVGTSRYRVGSWRHVGRGGCRDKVDLVGSPTNVVGGGVIQVESSNARTRARSLSPVSVWCGSTWYCRLTRSVKYQVAPKIRWVTGCLIRSRLLDCGIHGSIGSGVVIVLRLRVDWGVYGLLPWVRSQIAAGCTCLVACGSDWCRLRLWEHLEIQGVAYVREDFDPIAVNVGESLFCSPGTNRPSQRDSIHSKFFGSWCILRGGMYPLRWYV